MRKLVFCLFFISFYSYSYVPGNTIVYVKSITAYWAATASNDIYSYTFEGLGKDEHCGKDDDVDAISGDPNINRVLQMAYSLNEKVKVGISSGCVITGVVIDSDYNY
ncbi:hypothetical protein GKA92_23660 [Salmonella enterica subsp. enterica]|nr:hypothetical protein [Salmonella enterica subsp. enterica serovar Abaetetuba]